jgi:hypothetical protein
LEVAFRQNFFDLDLELSADGVDASVDDVSDVLGIVRFETFRKVVELAFKESFTVIELCFQLAEILGILLKFGHHCTSLLFQSLLVFDGLTDLCGKKGILLFEVEVLV